jgi:hypothetical protein
MSDQNHDDGQSESTAYETRDVRIRPLVMSLVGLSVAIIASYFIVLGVFRLFNARETAKDATADPVAVQRATLPPEQRLPPAPRIQADPAGEYEVLRRQEEEILTTYGWVDRQAGTVRIPVDQAMKLVVEQGLPVRQPASASPASGTPATSGPQGRTTAPPEPAAQKK